MPSDLSRFVEAQDGVYEQALAEIRRGAKRGHWMWFMFPQRKGLGRSPTAQKYAIGSLEEARAYLSDSVLGSRLRECVEALQDLTASSATQVFGEVDAMKLRSSLTLFSLAGGGPIFEAAVARWFGSPDEQTKTLLANRDLQGAAAGTAR